MEMDTLEDLIRKIALVDARLTSYERLHAEELSELKTMLQDLKLRQAALQDRDATHSNQHSDGSTDNHPPPAPQSDGVKDLATGRAGEDKGGEA